MDTKLATTTRVLWTGSLPIPENLRFALEQSGWDIVPCDADGPFDMQLEDVSLVVLGPDGVVKQADARRRLLEALQTVPAATVAVHHPGTRPDNGPDGCLEIPLDAEPQQIVSQLSAVRAMGPTIDRLRRELGTLRQSRGDVDKRLELLDEEMRLAARLQRDFLPRRMPEVGNVRFGVLFRPAGWVSGDIYEVTRLDETHVGFYVVDAVGHGMPAALLTMFIKKALQTKNIVGNTYQIVPPSEAMAELNQDICQQNLSSCQFCTAVYAVLDSANNELVYARAGHPEPILLRADGSVERLPADGALLGIFPEAEFECSRVSLNPGDRIVLYTDGVEDALADSNPAPEDFQNRIATLADAPRDEMLLQITAWIDENIGTQHEEDDITVLVVDVDRDEQ
ncbi:MAG: PP2C family protein-serine/threonine phosphatase [Phycisphaerae bacterium]